MRSTARLFAMVPIICCLMANWAPAQAQEFLQGSGNVLPGDPGKSGKESATGLPSGPILGPAIEPALPPLDRPLNLTEGFTLGGTQTSVTLSNSRGSAIFAAGNPSGDKSCLTAKAYMRPDVVNKNLHQNWISARNSCDRYIKIRVCYRGSANCILISIPPSQTKSAIIGYASTTNPMHYQIRLEE